jgi:methylamine--corrinoid protein Co-methyltransferase
VLWVENVVSQAFSRNAPCIVFGDIYAKSGALTTELLYETAANAIVLTLAGSHLEGPATADGAAPNCSGVEARLMAEVGQAVSRQGMSLEDANALVVRLLGKYEHVFDQPGGNPGVPLDQAIDLDTLRPVPAWSNMDRTARVELREMGLSELPART